ncbi:PCNA-associated factor-like isoform X2 [Perognathus longimembris pacificus]|uniref:PCNA-associated factor-like isoform X2 n=1 Tax=Perognathus longimembris pacificus TaxID=214514 RepID=UPI0020187CC3|nr:PCNA-associated factor-like isoform X2 [Perognathus longimembris pacificus]
MVRTKADSAPSTYRKVVTSCAPRKVLGSSTSAINNPSPSSRKAENKKEHVLCNLITQMMKTNRTVLFIFE